jgi:hypothetical protein
MRLLAIAEITRIYNSALIGTFHIPVQLHAHVLPFHSFPFRLKAVQSVGIRGILPVFLSPPGMRKVQAQKLMVSHGIFWF